MRWLADGQTDSLSLNPMTIDFYKMNERPKGRFFHTNYVVKVDGKELHSSNVRTERKDGKWHFLSVAIWKRRG